MIPWTVTRRRRRAARFVPADVPQTEADALIWLYRAANGGSWTNRSGWLSDPVVDNWYGINVSSGHVQYVLLGNNGLAGDVGDWHLNGLADLTGLDRLDLASNYALRGDISEWDAYFSASVTRLYLRSNIMSGDLSGWTLPANLTTLYIYANNCTADVSGWVIPASMESLFIPQTGITGVPDLSQAVALADFRYNNASLPQTTVDAVLAALYARRAAFTDATPVLLINGTNDAPSGAYADEDPPTTGLGYVYELANDPESEGFNTWTITYNGGSAP